MAGGASTLHRQVLSIDSWVCPQRSSAQWLLSVCNEPTCYPYIIYLGCGLTHEGLDFEPIWTCFRISIPCNILYIVIYYIKLCVHVCMYAHAYWSQRATCGGWFPCVPSAEGVLTLRHFARPDRYELHSVSHSYADPQYSWLVAGQEVGVSLILVLLLWLSSTPVELGNRSYSPLTQQLARKEVICENKGWQWLLRREMDTVESKTDRKDLG